MDQNQRNVFSIHDEDCFGCGICVAACNRGGVELALNRDGYYKRHLIADKCISCGKCIRVCPVNNQSHTINGNSSYVCHSKKPDDIINSSSGGFAYVLSKLFLKSGYAIVGAVWNKEAKEVRHIVVRDEKELENLRKSKYVQSYTVDAFTEVATIDKAVIIGTPCQIAGARRLYRDKEGFIFIDFDCMGPAGYGLWNKYLAYLETINPSGIQSLTMRTKKKSWMHYGTRVLFQDGTEYYGDKFTDPFCKLYHFAHLIQETCRNCRFLNASEADIRIGDGWGYTEGFRKTEIRNGLSIVTLVTERGKQTWSTVSERFVSKNVTREAAAPVTSGATDKLWQALRSKDSIQALCRIYENVSVKEKISRKVSILLSANDSVYLCIKRLISHKK